MANPFFSGRIPASLAEKIDNHLLTTGETRSELLVRLLRTEVNDNNVDNSIDSIVSDLLLRVKKLEDLANYQNDNKLDNIEIKQPQPEENQTEKPILIGSEIALTKAQTLYLKQIKDLVHKTDKAKIKKLLDLELIVQLGDDLILTNLGEAVLARSENL
jgi:predicted transcriptional regulator